MGGGKTSLLSSLLGELSCIDGEILFDEQQSPGILIILKLFDF